MVIEKELVIVVEVDVVGRGGINSGGGRDDNDSGGGRGSGGRCLIVVMENVEMVNVGGKNG